MKKKGQDGKRRSAVVESCTKWSHFHIYEFCPLSKNASIGHRLGAGKL